MFCEHFPEHYILFFALAVHSPMALVRWCAFACWVVGTRRLWNMRTTSLERPCNFDSQAHISVCLLDICLHTICTQRDQREERVPSVFSLASHILQVGGVPLSLRQQPIYHYMDSERSFGRKLHFRKCESMKFSNSYAQSFLPILTVAVTDASLSICFATLAIISFNWPKARICAMALDGTTSRPWMTIPKQ